MLRSLVGDEPDEAFRDSAPTEDDVQRALHHGKEALAVMRQISESGSETAARCLSNYSMVCILSGDFEEASVALHKAREIREDNGTLENPSGGKLLYNFGSMHLKRLRTGMSPDPAGDWESAWEHLTKALRIFHRNAVDRSRTTSVSEAKREWLGAHRPQ